MATFSNKGIIEDYSDLPYPKIMSDIYALEASMTV